MLFVWLLQYLHIFYVVIGVGGSGAAANGINLNAISTIGKNAGKGECYHHVVFVKYCIIMSCMPVLKSSIFYSFYFVSLPTGKRPKRGKVPCRYTNGSFFIGFTLACFTLHFVNENHFV